MFNVIMELGHLTIKEYFLIIGSIANVNNQCLFIFTRSGILTVLFDDNVGSWPTNTSISCTMQANEEFSICYLIIARIRCNQLIGDLEEL